MATIIDCGVELSGSWSQHTGPDQLTSLLAEEDFEGGSPGYSVTTTNGAVDQQDTSANYEGTYGMSVTYNGSGNTCYASIPHTEMNTSKYCRHQFYWRLRSGFAMPGTYQSVGFWNCMDGFSRRVAIKASVNDSNQWRVEGTLFSDTAPNFHSFNGSYGDISVGTWYIVRVEYYANASGYVNLKLWSSLSDPDVDTPIVDIGASGYNTAAYVLDGARAGSHADGSPNNSSAHDFDLIRVDDVETGSLISDTYEYDTNILNDPNGGVWQDYNVGDDTTRLVLGSGGTSLNSGEYYYDSSLNKLIVKCFSNEDMTGISPPSISISSVDYGIETGNSSQTYSYFDVRRARLAAVKLGHSNCSAYHITARDCRDGFEITLDGENPSIVNNLTENIRRYHVNYSGGVTTEINVDYNLWDPSADPTNCFYNDGVEETWIQWTSSSEAYDQNSSYEDPLINSNGRPDGSSYAIDAGYFVSGINDLFVGIKPDIGAYEFTENNICMGM